MEITELNAKRKTVEIREVLRQSSFRCGNKPQMGNFKEQG